MRGLEAFVAFDIMVLSRRGFYSVPFLRKCMKCMDRDVRPRDVKS